MTPAKKTTPARPAAAAGSAAGKPAARKPAARKTPPRPAKPQQPNWDIADIDQWGPTRHELGATIPEAGNSIYNETGGWRTMVPEIDIDKCIGCMLCYFYCPDASIIVQDGKAVAIDLAHCKGCGICAKECPSKAIEMLVEQKG